LRRHKKLGLLAQPDESERDFVARVQLAARELRDKELDDIEDKYEKKRLTIEERLAKAGERVERVKDQARDAKRQTAISFGSAVLGSLLGRSLINQSTIYRSTTAAKSASRAQKAESQVGRAEESYGRIEQQLVLLEDEMKKELEAASERYETAVSDIDTTTVRPLKRDVVVNAFLVVWLPE
jgi:multidrug resistance efflux pump